MSDWTDPREWDKERTQKSDLVRLEVNKEYYFEVRHKESRGGDHVAVGWSKPGEPDTAPSEIIPGSCLSLFTDPLASDLAPFGEWSIQLSSQLYSPGGETDETSLIDRIDNIILVLTVEGAVRWSA